MSGVPKLLEDFLRVDEPDDWELVLRGRQFDPARLLADALDMVELYTWNGNPVAAVSASVEHCGQTFGDRAPPGRQTAHLDVLGPPVAFAAALAAAGVERPVANSEAPNEHA